LKPLHSRFALGHEAARFFTKAGGIRPGARTALHARLASCQRGFCKFLVAVEVRFLQVSDFAEQFPDLLRVIHPSTPCTYLHHRP
jgi:hypothetical protein